MVWRIGRPAACLFRGRPPRQKAGLAVGGSPDPVVSDERKERFPERFYFRNPSIPAPNSAKSYLTGSEASSVRSEAVISPVVFSFVGSQVSLPLLDSLLRIGRQMIPLLILPFVAALALQRFWPRAYRALRQRQSISFYLWAVSLTIVMGNTTSFLIRQDSSRYGDELLLAGASLVACVCQFVIGRRIGRKYDLKISGAQGLGQKNTVLAIWMAQTYLLPIASVGPAAYVVWQNVINSWQLWKKRRSEAEQQI